MLKLVLIIFSLAYPSPIVITFYHLMR